MTMGSDLTRLDDLASRINAEHAACESAMKEGLRRAIEAGRLLIEARGMVEHGGWAPWIRDHCRFGLRTAQGYMKVARYFGGLTGPEAQRVALLSYREALAEMAT